MGLATDEGNATKLLHDNDADCRACVEFVGNELLVLLGAAIVLEPVLVSVGDDRAGCGGDGSLSESERPNEEEEEDQGRMREHRAVGVRETGSCRDR